MTVSLRNFLRTAITTSILSTSLAAFEPRIVQPTLDESDVVVADLAITDKPYGVDPTGVKDCTEKVQKAIEDLSKIGGGVLYFPAGRYRFMGTLTLLSGVTLKGDWANPLKGCSGKGTIFMVYSGKGDEKGKPFIQSRRGPSAIKNLSFWYPEQNAENPVPYPPTILRETLPCIMMKVTFYNSWIGYEVLRSGGSPLISEVYGTFLKKGIQGDLCFEYGFFDRIYISPEIWINTPARAIPNAPKDKESRQKLVEWCRKNTVGLEFLKNDNIEIFHVTVKDAKVGIYYGKSTRMLKKGGKGTYGFRMKIDAEEVFDHAAPWVGDVKDIDRYPQTSKYDFNWPKQWKPAREDLLIVANKAPYSAKGDGATDNSGVIQRALSDAAQKGGGIVYLNPGEYAVKSPITIPRGVELRGPVDYSERGSNGQKNTLAVIHALYGDNAVRVEQEPALISLEANSSMRGVMVLYPNQSEFLPSYEKAPTKKYPWTIRALGENINIQYVTIKRAWNAIDLASHDCSGFVLKDFWMSPLNYGVRLGGGTDGGTIMRVLQTMGAWHYPKLNTPNISDWKPEMAGEWIWSSAKQAFRKTAKGFTFGDVKNVQAYGAITFMFHRHMMFVEENGKQPENLQFFFCPSENTGNISLYFDRGNDLKFFGIAIAPSKNVYFLETTDRFDGDIDMYGLLLWGDPAGGIPLVKGGTLNLYPRMPKGTAKAWAKPGESRGLVNRKHAQKKVHIDRIVIQNGKKCWLVGEDARHAHIRPIDIWVDYQELRWGQAPHVEFELDYLDSGTGTIRLTYDSKNDNQKSMGTINLQDTGKWIKKRFALTDAMFAQRITRYCRGSDIQVHAYTESPFYVSYIGLTKTK